ncbi:Hypothetical Protein CGB_K0030W [Cryptococcus gattii WM276]|uniref:Uncharacterized protein n=1 Tax=Cryptococcus gattii serotype B (strain WM276 / ATCC MYA-4071) TaxID=367775 RepID=E6RD17_CRYGW|nr:Hypothetical Protein CGB_K0030W [Cryptococcus gattii WM276]ADV24728.1 Hypothetical Protein CGB_K0030W [Cryptococcus gattii WM276]
MPSTLSQKHEDSRIGNQGPNCKLRRSMLQPLLTSLQTQVLKNVRAVLIAVDADPSNILKTTVFLQSMGDFAAFNQVYAEFFGETKPARSCVEVAKLPLGALVEIE